MPKHTPGPLIAIHERGSSRISPKFGQFRLATLESDNHRNDANLFAAAPEMLEALKASTRTLELILDDDYKAGITDNQSLRDEVLAAKAAIAKAEEGS